MQKSVLEFIHALRSSGVRVALSENIDCFQALEVLGLERKPTFKSALRSTLVKRAADIPTFEKLFDLYFTSLTGDTLPENETDPDASMLSLGPLTIQEFVDSFFEDNRERFEGLYNLFQWQLGGDFLLTMMEIGAATGLSEISNPLQVGFFARKIRDSLGWNAFSEELERLRQEFINQGYSPEDVERAIKYIQQRMQRVFDEVRAYVRRELDKKLLSSTERMLEEELLNKSFYQLTQREIEMMRDIVAQLGRKMRDTYVLRTKRRHRGRIDVKRLIRRNMQYGGVPIELCYRNRRREKPQIFALCDISDSVSYAARFMLQFLYTLQELFSKVRTFVFVTEIAEVTRLFSEHEVNAAIQLAFNSRLVDYNGHSNFGYAFHRFRNEFVDSVTSRTTLMIMGDARNNRNDPRTWAFKEITEKAKRVIWLNPEAKAAWRLGDSVMHDYLPYCDEVYECRNAKQLMRIVDKLLIKR
ncbi:MAG: VWA domain-containing protein [Candidatus Abyssobacteria bacterium SURF_17]|jgi:uncharacterized protein with von Willebrand factor type A (vWA) domain|uniref:VWA domain-containing protein n=1 Tax=Candidatus Abyssobacteria bacterium SURF_17 TaxID=2093361 RepID=A0A419EZ94_9BACT|nr:MAG: VWA domain-containing protein [Candidatus Abyssubacteria bacterium SURF_17]